MLALAVAGMHVSFAQLIWHPNLGTPPSEQVSLSWDDTSYTIVAEDGDEFSPGNAVEEMNRNFWIWNPLGSRPVYRQRRNGQLSDRTPTRSQHHERRTHGGFRHLCQSRLYQAKTPVFVSVRRLAGRPLFLHLSGAVRRNSSARHGDRQELFPMADLRGRFRGGD